MDNRKHWGKSSSRFDTRWLQVWNKKYGRDNRYRVSRSHHCLFFFRPVTAAVPEECIHDSGNQRACFTTVDISFLDAITTPCIDLVGSWTSPGTPLEHYSRSRGTARKSTRKPAEALAVSWCRAPDAPVARSFLNAAAVIIPVLSPFCLPPLYSLYFSREVEFRRSRDFQAAYRVFFHDSDR